MIILTGASGGIGQAILHSLSLLDEVAAIYFSKAPNLSGLKGVKAYKVDLTSELEIDNFVLSIKKNLKNITLIHSAALSKDGLSATFKTEFFDQIVDVNLKGNFLLTRALLIPMIEEKWGRVIHISSIAGMRGVPGTIAYSVTKTGLIGMSRVLANEYARLGITSNVLVLGYFNTGLIETLSEKKRLRIIESIPSAKLGNPSNIVNAVEFLIKSDYVNGSTVNIDGGI